MAKKPTYEELEQKVKNLEKKLGIRAQLRDRLQILPLAIEQSSEGYAVSDMDGNLEYLNDAFAQIHGYSAAELIGKHLSIFHSPHQIPSVGEANRELKQTGSFKGEIWHTRRDGTVFPAMMDNSVVKDDSGKPIGMMGRLRDISDIKQAEDALRESEGRYRSLADDVLDSSAVGIFILDCDFRVVWVNQALEDYFGLKRDEIIGKDKRQLIHERIKNIFENPDSFTNKVFNTYNDNTYVERFECHVLPNGEREERWLEHRSQPIQSGLYAGGRIEHYYDITERKQAEEVLRESEERYRSLFTSTNDGACVHELIYKNDKPLDYRISDVNPRYESIIGVKRDDVIGVLGSELYGSGEAPYLNIYADVVKTGRSKSFETYFAPMSKYFLISVFSTGTHKFATVFQDITERKRAEEEKNKLETQLQRAQKMEAMGLMAGGVAHDLNNILSGIVSYPELLLMDLPEDSPLRKPIKTIQESGMRAADVVEDLLTIARGVATGKEVLNLNTMVEKYLDSAEHQKLEKIHPLTVFKTELDSELLNITGSASHVKKVLMNLIVNASEAIEGRGSVTVSTMNRYLDEPLKGYENVRTGEYVVLAILDDGSGISPKDLDRIFEPFYTKKEMGRSGTGLGLAVVWNTVQDHKGYINVESSGNGTVFELYFPVTRKDVSDEKAKIPLENYLGQGEKILVVDDEERQREIACGILTKLGYNPEAVSSGEEAIEYMKENAADLIVLDMVMPKGINGRQTYEEIIKIRLGQKAVIASGYAKTKEVDIAQELGAGKYIKKPYTLERIGVAVKKELEK